MLFIGILVLTAMAIASVAAYFSIVGLASIFASLFWPVVIMGVALEAGKLVAASFVYRYWDSIKWTMKTYLISAILVLMMITSTGIFGMLSSGYQKDSLPLKEITAQVELLKQEKSELIDRKKQIDGIIAAISPNYITKRIEQQKTFAPETDRINHRIPEITAKIQELTNKKINQEVHVGPITFIAKALGKDIDDATKYMVFLIMFAFDPLAVILTIGANMAIVLRFGDKRRGLKKSQKKVSYDSKDPFQEDDRLADATLVDPLGEVSSISPSVFEFDDEDVDLEDLIEDKKQPSEEDKFVQEDQDRRVRTVTVPFEEEEKKEENHHDGDGDGDGDEPNPTVKTEKMFQRTVLRQMNQEEQESDTTEQQAVERATINKMLEQRQLDVSEMVKNHSALPKR